MFVGANTIGDSVVFQEATSIGIGTVTPLSKLHVTGAIRTGLASSVNGSLVFQNSANANILSINSGETSVSHSWTLPLIQGGASTVLTNDGTGVLSWSSPSIIGVSGTIDRISITAGAIPVIDISVAYAGQTSIIVLGTITTGTWSATTIAANKGGTGFSSYVVGDILYADTTSTLSKLADVAAGSYLRSGGVNTAPIWSTTTLPNSATTGDILYASASNVYSNLAGVAVGKILRAGGVGAAPVWSTPTFPNTATSGKVLQGDGTNVVLSAFTLPTSAGATGTILRSDGTNYVASTNTYPNTTGSGEILYATSANVIGSSSNLIYNGTNLTLTGGYINAIKSGTGIQDNIYASNSQTAAAGVGTSINFGNILGNRSAYIAAAWNGAAETDSYVSVYTRGSNALGERVRILSSGELLVGTGTLGWSGGMGWFQNNRNYPTAVVSCNTTSGADAYAGFVTTITSNLSSSYMGLATFPAAATALGLYQPSSHSLIGVTLPMYIGTYSSAHLYFGTSNAVRATILSSGEFLVGASSLVSSEFILFRKDANAGTQQRIYNATSGTAAWAGVSVVTPAAAMDFVSRSALYTTSGMAVQNGSDISTNAPAGLGIGTTSSSPLSFWTNNISRISINSAGDVTHSVGQNAITSNVIQNLTDGAAARTLLQVIAGTTNQSNLGIYVFSNSYSTSGAQIAGTCLIQSNSIAGMTISQYTAQPISFWTNNTQRVSVNAGGGFIIQSGNKLWMKNTVSNTNYWSAVLVSGVLTWTDSGSTALPTT
jgi:hypothetical protein